MDLTWVEAPVDIADIKGLRKVSDGVLAAVCAGKQLHDVNDYLPYFRQGAIDVVQIDITRAGITGAIQIADAAYGLELPVTLCSSPANIAAHLSGVLPNFMSLEVIDPTPGNVRIEDGRAIVGDLPGIGLTIDTDEVSS